MNSNKKIIDKGEGFMKNIIKNKKTIIIIIVTIVALFLLSSSITTIKSGEVGIRIRFGKVLDKKLNEGFNFQVPIVERIEKVDIKVQKSSVETSSSSKDLQEVQMSIAVNYRIDSERVIELYKNVGMNYRSIILEPAIEESIKAVTSQYTAEELITNRSEVSQKCMEELSKKVEKYGILVKDFNITNFNFSPEFNRAIEEKQVAEQKVLTAKQELEREKIEAEKIIVAAEAEKKANELKEKSLTDKIIKEKFIEKWDGQLPRVVNDKNIIDITELTK